MYIYLYFILVNLTSALAFAADKRAAVQGRERMPERTLHLLEALGGVWAVMPLMYLLHHKNRKKSYFLWTWGIAVAWVVVLASFALSLHPEIKTGLIK